jgi:hypothetical protein
VSTEQQIAVALSARAGGITMDTSTLEQRFAQVQERGRQDRRRRRAAAVGAAVLATAAAVLAAFTLVGALPGQEEAAPYADREVAELSEPYLVGSGRPGPGGPYSVAQFALPFTFELPPPGEVPGVWGYSVGDSVTIGLEASPSTGHANLTVSTLESVYDPQLPQPVEGSQSLVPAPQDAEAWERWLEQTGVASVSGRQELDVGGVPAIRLTVDVADDLPASGFPCAPGESCMTVAPDGPSLVGSARSEPVTSELTVLDVEGRAVVVTVLGLTSTSDQWLPLIHSVVGSLRFS